MLSTEPPASGSLAASLRALQRLAIWRQKAAAKHLAPRPGR